MQNSIITLSTDFGAHSPYVAAMKGVILGINPAASIIDLSHEIPAHDLLYTSFFLCSTLPYFSKEILHVVVVDPGVGTDRALLYVETEHHRLLVPDNGCWTELACQTSPRPLVVKLTETQFWRPTISPTFHGRDILAPVAGQLSLGLDCRKLGGAVDKWVQLSPPLPKRHGDYLHGEVLFSDRFGNLTTNLRAAGIISGATMRVLIGDTEISRYVRTYGEAAPGTEVVLIGSSNHVEIAIVQGSAAARFNATAGTPVRLYVQ
jgi:S-adenosylmethionine hydrolase